MTKTKHQNMFSTIYQYELKHWLRQPSIYVYALFFFLFAWAGGTGNSESPDAAWSGRMLNSAVEMFRTVSFFDTFLSLLIPAILGLTIYRDFRSNMHQILYAYPFEKSAYLWGKFLSGLTATFGVALMIGLGIYVSTFMSWINPESIFGFDIRVYAQIFGCFVLPNLILVGALVFAVVGWTRNIYAGFISVLIFVILKEGLGNLFSPMHYPILAGILDSSGENAVEQVTNYWTIAERNENLLPMSGLVLLNRVFWLAVAALIFGAFYRNFSFSQTAPPIHYGFCGVLNVIKRNSLTN
jgi:ABC-2 type transport system permease protein